MVSLLRKMLKKVLLHTCAIFLIFTTIAPVIVLHVLNPLSVDPTKWSKTLKKLVGNLQTNRLLKQFVGNLPTNCLSVFDHLVKLALKGLNSLNKYYM